ncbi:ClpXP protease specificity-enhancing factor SspB [Asticcacaulis sp. BYS171W]|uniref:ClpXP protease specificity-enhancing factor SspB n=1 Tax=Asticcacaulis aquaticus TaxID=2984212 RepID=A0ABT5HQR7_9CAUL|nr:ClpXP protease specificity-enhancing factor SspB [Asticcacaulis aquaticus]MDC7682412.1 ClpXP protease specificity-enhancing factor SspB [Asticcacaulis aquaticus]
MSDTPAVIDHMDYANLTQNALRGVIRQALLRAAQPGGLPGDHHFYVTFLTRAEGVSIPDDLLQRYPNDITIVLQHQFRDLKVEQDRVSVTLSFGGMPKVLRFPYAAITRFYDPSVQFILEFEVEEAEEANDDLITEAEDTPVEPVKTDSDDAPKVVSLDQFRKK